MLTKKFHRRNFTPRRVRFRALKATPEGAPDGWHPEDFHMGYRAPSFRAALMGLASMLTLAAAAGPADAANKVLKIGFVGVTSGPAAAWGTSNVRSMQTLADWWDSTGA